MDTRTITALVLIAALLFVGAAALAYGLRRRHRRIERLRGNRKYY